MSSSSPLILTRDERSRAWCYQWRGSTPFLPRKFCRTGLTIRSTIKFLSTKIYPQKMYLKSSYPGHPVYCGRLRIHLCRHSKAGRQLRQEHKVCIECPHRSFLLRYSIFIQNEIVYLIQKDVFFVFYPERLFCIRVRKDFLFHHLERYFVHLYGKTFYLMLAEKLFCCISTGKIFVTLSGKRFFASI